MLLSRPPNWNWFHVCSKRLREASGVVGRQAAVAEHLQATPRRGSRARVGVGGSAIPRPVPPSAGRHGSGAQREATRRSVIVVVTVIEPMGVPERATGVVVVPFRTTLVRVPLNSTAMSSQ